MLRKGCTVFMKASLKKACVFLYVSYKKAVKALVSAVNRLYDHLCLVRYLKKRINSCSAAVSTGGETVFVIAPHIDDEILGLGGTIKMHIDNHDRVIIIYTTDGRRSASRKYSASEMAAARRAEGIEISKKLNCQCIFFDAVSMEWSAKDYIDPLAALISQERPDVIYTVNPIDVNLDHFLTTQCLCMTLDRLKYNCKIRMYQVQSVLPINKWKNFVDITDVIDLKTECLAVFESQMGMIRSFEAVIYFNRCIAKALTTGKYAEIFYEIRQTELSSMIEAAEAYDTNVNKSALLVSSKNSIKRAISLADRMEQSHEQ